MARSSESIKQIFGEALEVPPADLPDFLARACGGDEEIEAELTSLLHHHHRAGRFLDADSTSVRQALSDPVGGDVLNRIRWLIADERPGSLVDRYRLLEVIGEGGYGVVFRAQQQHPVQRVVALKVIRKGMEAETIKVRFEAERQILALMDHPCIAKLFDAGTTGQGRPYFVMELVDGVPITQYCNQRKLPVRRRLELFIPICRAIHHAHQKGIIHLDLKPSNVLVKEVEGEAIPKVIDFGVSRVTGDAESSPDRQILGTPKYMSPEQASEDHAAMDTRSDIYSLGAMLYELVAGVDAVQFADRNFHTVSNLRAVYSTGGVEPPGARLRAMNRHAPSQDALNAIAQARSTSAPALLRMIQGDLDWIITKAIQRDRTNRYDSAAALADDLEYHLQNRPIRAAPPNATYVFRKFCSRNIPAVAFTLATCLSVVAALMTSLVSLTHTQAARDRAVIAENQRAELEALAVAKLRQSYIDQARAGLHSRLPGQRIDSLRAIAAAARIAPSLELRNEAIACMSLPDIDLSRKWKLEAPESDISYSSNMDRYALADSTGTIRVYRMSDRQQICQLPPMGSRLTYLFRFSPDGNYIAAVWKGRPDGLRVWDLTSGRSVFQTKSTWAFDFSHDGRFFAVWNDARSIDLYELPSIRKLKSLPCSDYVDRLRVSPTDDRIAVTGTDNSVRVIAVASPSKIVKIPTAIYAFMEIAWHPEGQIIAVTGLSPMTEIQLFNANSGQLESAMKGHLAAAMEVAFTGDGRYLASGGWDASVKLWDVPTGAELLSVEGFQHTLRISGGNSTISADARNSHQCWPLVSTPACRSFFGSVDDSDICSSDVSPDGTLLASATGTGIRIWDINSGRTISFVSAHGARTVLFSNDGILLYSSTADGVLEWKVAELAGRRDVPEKRVSEATTTALALSRDGNRMVFGKSDGSLWLATPNAPAQGVALGSHSTSPRFVTISPDGAWAASSARPEKVFKIWNLTTHRLEAELPLDPSLDETGNLEFSSDGRFLVTSDHVAYRWLRVGDWKLLLTVHREDGTHSGLIAFSPDGKLAAMVDPGHSITLADPVTGAQLAVLETPATPRNENEIGFSRDSRWLTISGSHFVTLWDIPMIRKDLRSMNLDWQ